MSELNERTLAVIKPDAEKFSKEVEQLVKDEGFAILQQRRVLLTPEQASDFYEEHLDKPFFLDLIAYMTSGPVVAYALSKPNAVQEWRTMIGPTNVSVAKAEAPDSLRARFGTDDNRNGFHGSDSLESSEREIRFFFPSAIVEPVMSGQAAKDYLALTVNPTLLKGLTQLCKHKPADPIIWLADWLLVNNPNKPVVEDFSPQVEPPDS